MINENMMFECEWCHADLGSNPKAYDEHVKSCPAAIGAYKGQNYTEGTFDEYPPLTAEESKILFDAVSGALIKIIAKRTVNEVIAKWQRGAVSVEALSEKEKS